MTTSPWWQSGSVYQVYPRSFADTDGDGIGDLDGIRAHLDHVAALGCVAVWLSPVFVSPMADAGYDVSDYRDVDPVFGTLADLDALVAECHRLGLRVVLDWVLNHTSDQHPWFQASRSSRSDPRRDWYVWRDGSPHGGPPNNWRSRFDAVGPGWTRDPVTGQWYLHSFMPQQPDLNWDNAEVVEAMHADLRWWMDRGVDGFRLDAVHRIAKDPQLRDNVPGEPARDEDWPETMNERLRGLRRVTEEQPDRMLVGELVVPDLARFVRCIDSGDQLHLAHWFELFDQPWTAAAYATSINRFLAEAGPRAWPTWFLSNHDLPRVASRWDHDGLGPHRARAVAVLTHGLRGTPFVYQGEELGLPDAVVPPEAVVDVDGRDPQRAPLPWVRPSLAGPGAGFTTGTPWLPLVADAERLAVDVQDADPTSTLSFCRELGRLRRSSPALQRGTQSELTVVGDVLCWLREDPAERVLVAVAFGAAGTDVPLPEPGELVLSTVPGRPRTGVSGSVRLGPSEAVVVRFSPPGR